MGKYLKTKLSPKNIALKIDNFWQGTILLITYLDKEYKEDTK
jgi:hypothetical protein